MKRRNSKKRNVKKSCGPKKSKRHKKSCGCSGKKNSLVNTLNQMGGFVRDGSVQFFHTLTGTQ